MEGHFLQRRDTAWTENENYCCVMLFCNLENENDNYCCVMLFCNLENENDNYCCVMLFSTS